MKRFRMAVVVGLTVLVLAFFASSRSSRLILDRSLHAGPPVPLCPDPDNCDTSQIPHRS
jgi:hypothetical protein